MKEVKIEDIQKEILDQACAHYEEVKKTGDWKKFGLNMKNLFRSYALGTKEVYQQAMLEIISKKPTTQLESEIIGGNYGLYTQAMQQPETTETMETAQKIAKLISEKAAETYLKGCDKCIVWAIQKKQRIGKAIDQAFKDITTIAFH